MVSIRKSSNYIIAFVIILLLNFLLPRLMPGDPLTAIYGDEGLIQITPEIRAQLEERLALNKSIGEQFLAYVSLLLKGDLGQSYYYNAPVTDIILGALPWTALLVATAIILSTVFGLILGIESGWRRNTITDRVILAVTMLLDGLPDFFLGMIMLIVFGVLLGLLPLAGGMTPYAGYEGLILAMDILKHLILPAASLMIVNTTGTFLMTRNTMVSTLGEAFVFTARAKGLKGRVIRYRHAGRNSLLPVVTHTGLQFGRLMAGAIFIETVFSYPGLGLITQKALQTRDYPVLQGVLLTITLLILITNFLVDLLNKKIDPRLDNAH